jgi:hypothetical protein
VLRRLFLVLGSALALSACAYQGPSLGGLLPGYPSLRVQFGQKVFRTVVNGYQWTSFGQTTIADAAYRPAKGLPVDVAAPGEVALLAFSQQPSAMQMTVWHRGKVMAERNLTGLQFVLPRRQGEYTYEIAAHWGASYVNYDFAVRCVAGRPPSAP